MIQMNVNFEAIEKAWFKPKKTVLDELEYMVKKCTKYTSILNCDEEFIKVDDILYIIQELKKEMRKV